MEITLQFIDWQRYKRILLLSFIGLFGILVPGVVIADEIGGYDTEKLIGIIGAADSNLVIGRDGNPNSYLDIAFGGSHFHPDDPAYVIVSLVPLLYVAMLIIVLLGLFLSWNIKSILIAVIAIYVASALLPMIQEGISNLIR